VHNGRTADSIDPASAQISGRTASVTQDRDESRTSTGHQCPRHLESEAIGEIDTTEDSIDGMGAIKFTDEEDSAFFGQ
jgi:hypothetical protein